jgi:hypothetical protein
MTEARLRKMLKDRDGNFAVMTSLLAVPLLLSGGVAVDFSLAVNKKSGMQELADSAALAGASVFDGTNLDKAQAEAKSFIASHSTFLSDGGSSTITAEGRIVHVELKGASPTSFMSIANIKSVDIAVVASAVSSDEQKPFKTITLKPTLGQGHWYKSISVVVVRPGSDKEIVLGTVTYRATTLKNQGMGTMTVHPTSTIDLGEYEKLFLKMDVKWDPCPLKHQMIYKQDDSVTCVASSSASLANFNATVRSDDPKQAHHLFVNGTQVKKGVATPLDAFLTCDKSVEHAWEDGGGFSRQDFFYTITAGCNGSGTTAGASVRLVR